MAGYLCQVCCSDDLNHICTGAAPAGKGHNAFAASQLRSLIERVEHLEEEKSALADDIREVYSEAKSFGFDTKIMRRVVQLRKMDAAERQEAAAILDLYMSALGMKG